MVWLRLIALFSSGAAIAYGFHAAREPLWVPILWNALFAAVNAFHLAFYRWRAREVTLDPLEDFLFKTVLANFPPAEVRSFVALGAEGDLPASSILIRENTEIQHLFCVLKGNVDVLMNGNIVAKLGPGRFVGEMSLLTRSQTRADVVASSDAKLLAWTHESIDKWVDGDAARLGYLQTAMGTQVVEELLRQQSTKPELRAAK